MTPGESCAGGRWGAQSPRCPESAQLDDPRRLFEGCAGAWRGRHCQRNPELSLIGIRDDGQAEPPWCRAATSPPCRPARKPRPALVPAVLNRGIRDTSETATPTLPNGVDAASKAVDLSLLSATFQDTITSLMR